MDPRAHRGSTCTGLPPPGYRHLTVAVPVHCCRAVVDTGAAAVALNCVVLPVMPVPQQTPGTATHRATSNSVPFRPCRGCRSAMHDDITYGLFSMLSCVRAACRTVELPSRGAQRNGSAYPLGQVATWVPRGTHDTAAIVSRRCVCSYLCLYVRTYARMETAATHFVFLAMGPRTRRTGSAAGRVGSLAQRLAESAHAKQLVIPSGCGPRCQRSLPSTCAPSVGPSEWFPFPTLVHAARTNGKASWPPSCAPRAA